MAEEEPSKVITRPGPPEWLTAPEVTVTSTAWKLYYGDLRLEGGRWVLVRLKGQGEPIEHSIVLGLHGKATVDDLADHLGDVLPTEAARALAEQGVEAAKARRRRD